MFLLWIESFTSAFPIHLLFSTSRTCKQGAREAHHPSPHSNTSCKVLRVDAIHSHDIKKIVSQISYIKRLSPLHKGLNNLSRKGHVQVIYSNLLLSETLKLEQLAHNPALLSCECLHKDDSQTSLGPCSSSAPHSQKISP